MSRFFVDHPSFLSGVPAKPGVYIMKDPDGMVLYVGKARDLRKRLASYARVEGGSLSKTAKLLDRVDQIETIITGTEKEALILEASLIKKHKPKYNIILRDDKNYPYIKVTVNEQWPRVVMSRRRNKDGARYFGPYASSSAMWATLNHLNAIFPLRRCKDTVLKEKARSCLNYQIGRCSGPCIGKISPTQYQEMVKNVLMVLEGRNRQLLQEIEQKMRSASEDLNFELAAELRDRMQAIKKTLEKQVVVADHSYDQDIWGFARKKASVALAIMLVRNGILNGFVTYFLAAPLGTDEEILAAAVERYYAGDKPVGHEIILPFGIENQQMLTDWLTDLRGSKVSLRVPQRGNLVRVSKLANDNAAKVFDDQDKKARSWDSMAEAMSRKLGLSNRPDSIECFDISNIGGKQAVGSLVAFVRGEKEKKNYRHYKIQAIEGPDDYAMMSETLYRRFTRDEDELMLPDLIVIDGGKGHLNVAVSVIADLGLQDVMDIVSIAKEKGEEGEKIYKPGRKNPLSLKRNDPVLLYLMKIRDEAHRFGITFHRRWRSKKTLQTPLDSIPGVGPSRKKKLLSVMGSLKRIAEASAEELQKVPGVGEELAQQIYEHFHGNK